MKNIIVVDCISTGINYIADIINRGYNPVVLEMKSTYEDVESYKSMLEKGYDECEEKFDMIFERDSYAKTLDAVKKYNPKLILPGSEHGVILATRLANDLGLLSNSIENIDAMTLKDKMHERLKDNGLRYIRGKLVSSVEEAVEFYDNESLKEVVIKPKYGAGSTNVRICLNKENMINLINDIFEKNNFFGEKITEILVQERIKGDEYIVNTVSHKGLHYVTLIWKYEKISSKEGAMICDNAVTVDELGIGEAEMIEYAYKVLDAIGILYGPVHGEYMIDENGPVLIEVNCRPCGGHRPAKFLDRIAGHHETDHALDSYLKPARFHENRKRRYRLLAHGALKRFNVPYDIIAKSSSMGNITPKLKSYYKTTFDEMSGDEVFFAKTDDLESSCGVVYLVHEDKSVLYDDVDYLRSVEKNSFSLVLSEEKSKNFQFDEDKIVKSLKNVVNITSEYGTGLLITDQFLDDADIVQVGIDDLGTVNGEFDYVIVNLNKSLINKRDDLTSQIILDIFSDIRVGGLVFVPENTYNSISSGRKGVEALLKSLNLKIEVPPYDFDAGIIASKNSF